MCGSCAGIFRASGAGAAATALRLERRYGTLEKGKVADLLVLGGNPEKDIRLTRKIEAVYKAGKAVYP